MMLQRQLVFQKPQLFIYDSDVDDDIVVVVVVVVVDATKNDDDDDAVVTENDLR